MSNKNSNKKTKEPNNNNIVDKNNELFIQINYLLQNYNFIERNGQFIKEIENIKNIKKSNLNDITFLTSFFNKLKQYIISSPLDNSLKTNTLSLITIIIEIDPIKFMIYADYVLTIYQCFLNESYSPLFPKISQHFGDLIKIQLYPLNNICYKQKNINGNIILVYNKYKSFCLNNIKSNSIFCKICGKNQEKKISLHEKHLQINNKYLNTYKEKISKGEPRIIATKYLHQVLLNDDEENFNNDLQNNNQNIEENKNIHKNNTINTIFNNENFNFSDELNNESNIINDNNINEIDSKNIKDNNETKIIYKPQFMMMNANIPEASSTELNNEQESEENNRYIELDETNTHSILTELLKDQDYSEETKDEIPVIENFEDVANDKIEIKEIKNKEKTLEELQNEANNKFGKEIVDEILNKYDEYQNDMNFDQTKELDELIFNKMKQDKKKYIDFLEIFYKIIYIKCAQQVENTK